MNMKSLGFTVAVTMLAITGPAMAQEPASITAYEGVVTAKVNEWVAKTGPDDRKLVGLFNDLRSLWQKKDPVVKDRNALETAKNKLESDKKTLENEVDALKKKKPSSALDTAANQAAINLKTDEIKKKTDEIKKKTDEIKHKEDEVKKIDDDITKKKPDIAAVDSQIQGGDKMPLVEIAGIASPVK